MSGSRGRERWRKRSQPRTDIYRSGEFWVSVDTHTGEVFPGGVKPTDTAEKNRVVADVLALLSKYGLAPDDPLHVWDSLFGA